MTNNKSCPIVIIEGVDGAGKTTLAHKIAQQFDRKAAILHSSYHKDINMYQYSKTMINAAESLSHTVPVIMDRWVASEYAYGSVFRDGESFDTVSMFKKYKDKLNLKTILCTVQDAGKVHSEMLQQRDEMFADSKRMIEVQQEFIEFVLLYSGDKEHMMYNYQFYIDDDSEEENFKKLMTYIKKGTACE